MLWCVDAAPDLPLPLAVIIVIGVLLFVLLVLVISGIVCCIVRYVLTLSLLNSPDRRIKWLLRLVTVARVVGEQKVSCQGLVITAPNWRIFYNSFNGTLSSRPRFAIMRSYKFPPQSKTLYTTLLPPAQRGWYCLHWSFWYGVILLWARSARENCKEEWSYHYCIVNALKRRAQRYYDLTVYAQAHISFVTDGGQGSEVYLGSWMKK